ncbi:MAG TPA: hypothetical protein VMZ05_00130 [Spirochaetota bacterium]|nr:hypothetical protein [Spirochaetota bacterium]
MRRPRYETGGKVGPLKKILVLENDVEAQLIDSVLTQRGIPHIMRSYHDTAMDGIFQTAKGWGHVESEESYAGEIIEIYQELVQNQ